MKDPAGRGRRAALVVLAVLAVGTFLWTWRRPAQAPPPPPAVVTTPETLAPPRAIEFKVNSVTGTADRAEAGGPWLPVQRNDLLGVDVQLRTGPEGRVEISRGELSQLTIAGSTQLGIRELTTAVHRFQMTRGIVTVDYHPDGGRVVRIEDTAGSAVAEAQGARFHVAAGGLTFAVASQTGSVALTAAGATVRVGAGEQALAQQGKVPTPARAIPTALLLKIAAASRVGAAGLCLDTTGRSEPGALVTLDGEPVPVGADGQFPIRAARRGAGGVTVRSVTADGRVAVKTLPCRAATDHRIEEFRVRWRNGEP